MRETSILSHRASESEGLIASLRERIVEFLKSNPGKRYTSRQLAGHLKVARVSISPTLPRLRDDFLIYEGESVFDKGTNRWAVTWFWQEDPPERFKERVFKRRTLEERILELESENERLRAALIKMKSLYLKG